MKRLTIRRALVALAIIVAVFCQGTWALAGTTGGISGQVTNDAGAPIAGAKVLLNSPSQQGAATTDNSGRFTLLSLAPDTYSIAIEKEGYDPVSYTGVSIFADNNQVLSFKMNKVLKTIAKVTSRSAGDVVKSGVTQDIYNVNATSIQKSAVLGGGGNLDSAYSAIASVPGVNVPIGGMGWNQPTYVRGSQSFFTGFEYDGIPVNRAFDNYNSSTESNLGLQELQVYTGGGPAANSSSGTSGFINQVIKTGTFPGFANLIGGIGADAFYHKLSVEAGGASPDRNFSYYVGLSGVNTGARIIDNNNGASYMGPGGIFQNYLNSSAYSGAGAAQNFTGAQALCNVTSSTPFSGPTGSAPTCLVSFNGLYGFVSNISDRENIVNFHFGIPRKNGLRDDLQLLYSASSLRSTVYSSANDLGTTIDPVTGFTTGQDLFSLFNTGAVGNPGAAYANATVYNQPFGTSIAGVTPTQYQQPSSVQNGTYIPVNQRDSFFNDTGIVKLQYTHALSDRAYVRAFGYTFFSDWTQAGMVDGAFGENPYDGIPPNYDLITHTVGGELQFADQLNEKNLLQVTGNYTQASSVRFNNTGYLGGSSPVGLISQNGGTYTCYDKTSGGAVPCFSSSYKTSASAIAAGGVPPVPAAAAAAGASWDTLWDGEASGTYNTVKPKFGFIALNDEFRPSDKLLLDAGVRYENFMYGLQNSNTPANQFYSQIVSNYTCYAPGYGVATQPLPPGVAPPAPVQYINGDCNTGLTNKGFQIPNGVTYVHPNGQAQDGVTAVPNFTASSPNSYSQNFYSLRLSATYTQSPDTVWRVSGGRFTEPPISASTQYLYSSGAGNTLWANFENLGFFSPFHAIPAQSATQYDLSLERHIRGTDMSFKLTPFYNFTNQYQADAFIGQGFVTQVPVGNFRSYGVELGVTKGDFSRNGLSGQVSLSYTNAKMQYKNEFGGQLPNGVVGLNNAISAYNTLANGAKCYTPSTVSSSGTVTPGSPDPSCAATSIVNPYFGKPAQGLLDPNGWYPAETFAYQPGVNTIGGYYDSPWVGSMILNYRKDKFAITPSLQFAQGTSYGSPYDVLGYDPRLCGSNSSASAITTAGTNPQQCNYLSLTGGTTSPVGYLYVPNPQTGSFATLGAFREPSIVTGNIQLSYDVSPRISAQLTLANVFHSCFGGTKAPWTSAYPAGQAVCGYNQNANYVSNYQNGAGQLNPQNTGAYDPAANGGVAVYPWQ
ncbi:MAG TPA: TonB-dependent receptor, partial [Candidatus Baltobacteraceae bacterium]|nr:TonB-dependent receptor [Candidatus Baltobacteraceae bacterium]